MAAIIEKLDINPDKVPNTKLGLHIFQIILGVVIFILEIVLFRADNSVINGNNGWPFGLVRKVPLFTLVFICDSARVLTGLLLIVFLIHSGLDLLSHGTTIRANSETR